jgi:hypothetical protein
MCLPTICSVLPGNKCARSYGGGRANLSDTLVGALWVADALFAFSSAGAKAFHLHWGLGGHPSGTLGQPNTGVQTNFHFDVRMHAFAYHACLVISPHQGVCPC